MSDNCWFHTVVGHVIILAYLITMTPQPTMDWADCQLTLKQNTYSHKTCILIKTSKNCSFFYPATLVAAFKTWWVDKLLSSGIFADLWTGTGWILARLCTGGTWVKQGTRSMLFPNNRKH